MKTGNPGSLYAMMMRFSGYPGMAIGLRLISDFRFPENLNYPCIPGSITEFWRHRHISLSTWFREYLYIPLGGDRLNKKRNNFNLFIVFAVTGFWHGAAWNSVLRGMWYGFFITIEKVTGLHREGRSGLFSAVRHLYLLLIVMVGWMMFRADTLIYAWHYLLTMPGIETATEAPYKLPYYADRLEVITPAVGIIGAASALSRMIETRERTYVRSAPIYA